MKQQVLLDLGSGVVGSPALSAIYERAYDQAFSWQVSPYTWGYASNGADYTGVLGVKLGVNWWLHQDFWPHPETPLLGWSVGPVLELTQWHDHWTDGLGRGHDDWANSLALGAQGGYQWVFHPGLTARLYVQADAVTYDLTHATASGGTLYGTSPLSPHAAVGWSF